jgi:LysM repeat protein
MKKLIPGWLMTLVLMAFALAIGLFLPRIDPIRQYLQETTPTVAAGATTGPGVTPTETLLPRTPLSTRTPRATEEPENTLKPPPTFEPPTSTAPPAPTASPTETQQFVVVSTIEGLQGLSSATPAGTPGCTKNTDWRLTYEVKFNDTLTSIAKAFNTDIYALAQGNCLKDANVLRDGQTLLVPGDSYPVTPEYVCEPIYALQPLAGTRAVEKEGKITFNWQGPRTPKNLIRVHLPSGKIWESVVELRQNDVADILQDFPEQGLFTWYIYPLNAGYQQVCPEGGPWTFYKEEQSPTYTPTPTITPTLDPNATPQITVP